MELLKSFGEEKMPSIINDPFKKNMITSIVVLYRRNSFAPYEMQASGFVEFKNNTTEGKQCFTGNTFDDVVLKIKAMLETL